MRMRNFKRYATRRYTELVLRCVGVVVAGLVAANAHAQDLAAVMAVAESATLGGTPAALRVPLPWKGDAAEGTSPDGVLRVKLLRSKPEGSAGELVTVEAVWLKRAWVRLAAIELSMAGDHLELVGRDLVPVRTQAAVLERFDPKWITVGMGKTANRTFVIDDSIDAVAVKQAGGRTTLRLELEAPEARPFFHDARCTKHWRDRNKHLAASLRLKLPDEKIVARMQILDGAPTFIVKAHFPDGRRAAFCVTDHADQTSARTLEALAHGLVAHKLCITKALFAHGSPDGFGRPQLEDPKVAELADAMCQAGSEIVPHSATPKPDLRPVTEAAMEEFERWHSRTWIDHQPETNCEAFGDEGWHVGGKFGIADLLVAHRYQYIWAEDDAPAGDLNLFQPRQLSHRAPTVWPIGRLDAGLPDSLWMFRSMWAFIEAKRFYAMYGKEQLDRLERERGLHIAHTYLETFHPKGTKFGMRNLLMESGGKMSLDPRFDALLADLEARQERGTMWVPTLGELSDRLRAQADVTVTLLSDGSAMLHASAPVPGATFVLGRPDLPVTLAGKPPRGLRSEGKETIFWDDLPKGDTLLAFVEKARAEPAKPEPPPEPPAPLKAEPANAPAAP
jgi:hypothetical protein